MLSSVTRSWWLDFVRKGWSIRTVAAPYNVDSVKVKLVTCDSDTVFDWFRVGSNIVAISLPGGRCVDGNTEPSALVVNRVLIFTRIPLNPSPIRELKDNFVREYHY